MLYANEGASVTIVDKAGFDRVAGTVVADDKITVTSSDATITMSYTIHFIKVVLAIEETIATPSVSQLLLYPNPTTDILNFKNVDATFVKVYSLDGNVVINRPVEDNSIDVSFLKQGIYFIAIADQAGQYKLSKFIKQ